MTLAHDQAQDLLEGYALWSLEDRERAAVDEHVAGCERCRADLAALDAVAAAIPESVVGRPPSPRLRERILEAARADVAPRRRPVPALRPSWALSLALLAIALVSGAIAARTQGELLRVQAERDEFAGIALNVSEGARWWYMSGVGSFAGSEGTLIDPKRGDAYVLFHGLKRVGGNERYAVWLIRSDGTWSRAASFRPSGEELQRVGVPLEVSEFVQCAVTIETRDSGAPQGAVAMQSRVFSQ
jgi:hypothetical protein